MKVKPKFNEVIFFYNELDLLKRRLKFGENEVNHFFVVNLGPINLKLEEENVTIISKIVDVEDFFSYEKYESFIKTLISEKISIEDLIIFSKVFEIPDYKKIISNYSLCKDRPLVMKHHQLFWNHLYTSDSPYYGTKIITMGYFLRQPQIIFEMENLNYPIFLNYEVIDGGYSIQGFDELDKYLESFIYWNKIKTDKSEVLSKLIHTKNNLKEFWLKKHRKKIYKKKSIDLPKIFRFSKNTLNPSPKKVLIKNSNQFVNENDFDFIVIPNEQTIEIQTQLNYKISFPVVEIYESKTDFKKEFIQNELLFVLKNLELQDYDEIYVTKKTDDLPSVFTYKKFKSLIPSNVLLKL